MAILDEDRGPFWLRDYGDVDVDVATLLAFGKSLMAELEQDYKPHAQRVFDDLRAQDGYASPEFVELVDILTTHQIMRTETANRIAVHANGVFAFANAAKKISENYGEADAYSSAKVDFVETLMTDASPLRDNSVTEPASGTTITSPGITTSPAVSTHNPGTTALGTDGEPLY